MNIITRAEKISDDMISRRRRLHRIPEVGLHLPQTAGLCRYWGRRFNQKILGAILFRCGADIFDIYCR